MWWPHPSALSDLSVALTDEEGGACLIHLSAPDGTECADWLAYFNETPEREEIFSAALIGSIKEQITLLDDVETQELINGQQD